MPIASRAHMLTFARKVTPPFWAYHAVTAASAIVSQGALISLGSYGSGVSIAAADTFAAAGVPAIGLSCTNTAVTEGHDFYFRLCFLDPFQGSVMAQFAWDTISK